MYGPGSEVVQVFPISGSNIAGKSISDYISFKGIKGENYNLVLTGESVDTNGLVAVAFCNVGYTQP